MKYLLVLWMFIIAAFYTRTATDFFGNNLLPASPAEVLADGIALLLFFITGHAYVTIRTNTRTDR